MMEVWDMFESAESLKNRVCLITGAAQGMGRSIAEHLCRAGASAVLADIQSDKAEAVAGDLRAAGHTADAVAVDVRKPESARAMAARSIDLHGRIDVLINNAGLDDPPGIAWELAPQHWIDIIDTNLSGQWWCTMAVLPHMLAKSSGRIIFVSSVSARRGGKSGSVAYNASKAGLIGLTIGLSVQVESSGILVNAIAPGPTGTGRPMTQAEIEAYQEMYPMGIVGPEPVARACEYLIGPGGDWISGAVLNVSGGGWRG